MRLVRDTEYFTNVYLDTEAGEIRIGSICEWAKNDYQPLSNHLPIHNQPDTMNYIDTLVLEYGIDELRIMEECRAAENNAISCTTLEQAAAYLEQHWHSYMERRLAILL